MIINNYSLTKIRDIFENYGLRKQIIQFKEEAKELEYALKESEHDVKVAKRFNSDVKDIPTRDAIIDEMADVMVMILQFQDFYQIEDSEIESIVNFKIDRQIDRINNKQ